MRNILPIFFLITCSSIKAQVPSWVWAQPINSSDYETSGNAVSDRSGNVYVSGYFTGSTLTVGGNTLTNVFPGKDDIQLSKFDPNGNVLWAKSFGSYDHDGLHSLVTDSVRNCYIIGEFSGNNITFGATTLLNAMQGTRDVFLAKLDSMGNTIWVKRFGANGQDYGMAVDLDNEGNIFFAGSFENTITIGTQTLIASFDRNSFLAKCDANGNVIWAQTACGIGNIAADNNGCVYVTGSFMGSTATFGSITYTNTSIGSGSSDAFIVKYDPDGGVIWGMQSRGNYSEEMRNIKTDKAGNVYFTGNFFTAPNVYFGSFNLSTPGIVNSFIGKMSPSGTILWIDPIVNSRINYSYGLSTKQDGYVHLCGTFDFPTTLGTSIITGTGNINAYVAKYDTSGNFIWAVPFNGNDVTHAFSVVANDNSEVYVYGQYNCSSGLTFGSTTLNYAGGNMDVYLAKLNGPFTGIKETENGHKTILLFPNPNSGAFIVKGNFSAGSEITLIDMLGRNLFSQKLSNGENQIKTEGISNGIYQYSILQNKTQIKTGKIIIE